MQVPSPCYVMEEALLRRNLTLISRVARESGVEIILAFKAFALWKSFPIFREYINSVTASSIHEARLAYEEFGSRAHSFSPAYVDSEFDDMMRYCSHISFNSLSQYSRFYERTKQSEQSVSCGIRINPEYSEIETELYNPCAPGSRFGVTADLLPDELPEGLDGFHCHCHCESSSYALENTLVHIEQKFGKWLNRIKWLNLGGGHLMTRKDYDVEHLIGLLKGLKARYPNLHIILEPGSAFAWQTGSLVSSVVDVVESRGIRTAILDVSFTCHMPDCLEMPYQPTVTDAEALEPDAVKGAPFEQNIYRLGGNSCLSGDYMGSWKFSKPLSVGDRVVFEDMIHYTTVKTNMFNGISHPSIAMLHEDGQIEMYKKFGYEDYRDRMC
ncbi:MAG: carboxynorspermidine decarboxylase [Bacteroidaceae bacterium]|nr:carboxynorspermidine decarboxylase [Bacteroidaceae bacterium]